MTYQKRAVFAISCILPLVLLSAVFVPAADTAYAQAPESITPTITLKSSPCPEDGSDPACLISFTTSLVFKIAFSSATNPGFTLNSTMLAPDDVEVDGTSEVCLIPDDTYYGYFECHIILDYDSTITLKIPAGTVFDTDGNTNSAAEITVKLDTHKPIITIPDEYLSAYDTYIQYVEVNQPYVEPDITCIDEIWEDEAHVGTTTHAVTADKTITTNLDPASLPKQTVVGYTCLDGSELISAAILNVIVVEDLDVINTPPTLLKIERNSPHNENTNSTTLTYAVFFSKPVVGVDESDFVLSPESTGTGVNATHPATDVSFSSASVLLVKISAATSGTYNLDLISSGHGIVDVPNHPLTDTTPSGVDHTYNVTTTTPPIVPPVVTDNTAPTLLSIERYDPASQTTSSPTLIYEATFSEDVTGVNLSDFVLSPTSSGTGSNGASPVTGIAGSGSVYYVTVTGSTDGTYNIDLISSGHDIEDTANNPLTDTVPTSGTDYTYTIDTAITDSTVPTLLSIERHDPAFPTTTDRTLIYKATFSEDVTGVNLSDFVLSPTSSGTGSNGTSPVTGIAGSGSVYYVTVSAATEGAYNIDLISSGHDIEDAASNPLTDTVPTSGTDDTYTVNAVITDSTAPTLLSIERHDPASQTTRDRTLVYKATFSESVTGVNTSDFVLSSDSAGTGINGTSSVTGIAGSGSVYRVTVSASSDGTYNIDLISSGHDIEDTVNNPLTNTVPTSGTDETYTVDINATDGTAPTLLLIERYDPAFQNTDRQTLIYRAIFSEDVEGVDTSDFVLSPDSTGGSITTITTTTTTTSTTDTVSGQFVQAESPGIAIPDLQTVSDAITVPDSGTATSVSVAVDIEHDYIGDLLVKLIAPDGTSVTLHDHAGSYTSNINQTYTPSFGSVQVAGDWILQINDGYADYPGTLNSWTLTINYTAPVTTTATSTATVSPIAGISGSGSTYYVTVSSSKGGMYNLDLISSDHGIADTSSNPLTNTVPTTGTDHTYDVNLPAADNTAPALESIQRLIPADEQTDNRTLVYLVTFSEGVTGVDRTDFALSSDSTGGGGNNGTSPVTHVSGSGSTYYVIVAASQDGTYNLDLVPSDHGIADAADNFLTDTAPTTGTDHTYAVHTAITDDTFPMLESIQRYVPTTEDTGNRVLVYIVTFSEDVTGVDASDFVLSSDSIGAGNNGTSPVTGISGSGSTYYVTVFASSDGTYNLDLVSSGHGIADTSSNPLTNTVPTTGMDQIYTVSTSVADSVPPTLESIQRHVPAAENTYSQTLIYRVTFSEDVTGVDHGDFVLSPDSTEGAGNGTSSVTGITGHGRVYSVIVAVSQDGTYNLDLVSSGHGIADTSSNPLTNTIPATGTDQTYTVSAGLTSTAPTLTSIERYSPAAGSTDSHTLIYRVTFSEDVAGVDRADFVLSPDSTGGNTTTTTTTTTDIIPGQFAQTRSPSLAIPDLQTVSDIIAIPDSGTATSVSAAVDIEHEYIGDILVELIAPDGTSRTLHDRTGGDIDNINQTYTPSFGSVQVEGDWILQVNDGYADYPGTLNSWTLTVNYTSTTTTITTTTITAAVSPVTDISGFGSTYYVTVAASKDGTYNLDLVSSDHGIADTADNPLTDTAPTTGTDQTYTFGATVPDDTAPTLLSIERYDPASPDTGSQTLIYRATFSENVTGVNPSDFVLSPTSSGTGSNGAGPVTDVSGSGSVYRVTVSAATEGTYNLDLVLSGHDIADAADNSLTDTTPATGTDQTYTVTDSTAPTLLSIERHSPAAQNTYDQTLIYKATFSEDVTGVGASDFVLSSTSTGGGNNGTSPVTGISGSDSVYYVAVSAATEGTYNLDLVSSGHGIADAASNPLASPVPVHGTDQTYTFTMGPTIETIQRYVPAEANTDSTSLFYTVYFSEDVTGVDASDFVLSSTSTGGGLDGANPIVDIGGRGKVYNVIVLSYQDGTYNLDLVSSGHGIADADGNPLISSIPTTGTDDTYTVSR